MLSDLWDEIKQNIKDSFKYLWSKFKYVLLALLVVILFSIIFVLEIKNPDQVESQEIYIGKITINNLSSWISIIAIPITAIWAMYQFKKSVKTRQQEKATEIAKEYSKELIDKCGIICGVYKSSSLNELLKLNEKDYSDFKNFNVDELRKIYDDDFPTRYNDNKKKAQKELNDIYHNILIQKISDNGEEKKTKVYTENGKICSIEVSNRMITPYEFQNKDFPFHFYDLVSDTLNQLEYICMDISSKATDSEFIYQSLHQNFLRTIRILAVDISVDNCNFSDKYYTNIIHVYNEWTMRYIKDKKKENRKKEKINKILNPKIKVV